MKFFAKLPSRTAAELCGLAVLVFGLLAARPLLSQLITSDISQYAHTSWLVRDGHFASDLTAITQTQDGYIWVGTESGLLRFDGVSFTPAIPRGGESIAKREVTELLGARDGSLWIGVYGVGLVHLKNGRMTTVAALNGVVIMAILEDRSGDIWAAGLTRGPNNRLCRIHEETAQCFGDTNLFGIRIERLFQDKGGTLWVGADSGFWRWTPGEPKLFRASGPTSAYSLAMNAQGLFTEIEPKHSHPLPNPRESQLDGTQLAKLNLQDCLMLTDREGGVWFGTKDHGLSHFTHGRVDTYQKSDGLSSDSLEDLFEDHEGNIWVATPNGLDRFRKPAIALVTKSQGLSSDLPWSLLTDNGALWVASQGGLDLVSDKGIQHIHQQDGQSTDDILSLYRVGPGHIIIARGVQDGLASILDGHLRKIHTSLGENTFVVTSDGDQGLWVCNREAGLGHVLKDGKVQVLPWSHFGTQRATAMAFDSKRNGVWLAFDQGDLEFLQNNQVKSRYLNQGDVFVNPRDLSVTADGTVWLSSHAGLTAIHDGVMATMNSRNGLPCDAVNWRHDDIEQSTWLELWCGLVRLAPGELDRWLRDPNAQIHIRNSLDTFEGTENRVVGHYYTPTVINTPDGRLAFATSSGLAVIDPHGEFVNRVRPPVHVEILEADAQMQLLDRYVSLPPKTHSVRIGYNASSFRIPQKVRFRYKLEGYDTQWSEVVGTREAVYTNLPPAKYRFHVIACNDSGIWNETGDTLSFTVRAAFYQTRWFLFLCFVVLAVLTWMLYQSRVNYLYRQITNRVEAQASERLSISRDLHDTLLQGIQGLILSFHAISEEPTLGEPVRQKIITLSGHAEEVMQEGRDKIRPCVSKVYRRVVWSKNLRDLRAASTRENCRDST